MRSVLRLVKGSCSRHITTTVCRSSETARNTGFESSFTDELHFLNPLEMPTIPTFRVLDSNGNIKSSTKMPEISDDNLVEIYKKMSLLSKMDKILLQSQRQGRVSFYMTCSGEEAAVIGSAAALSDEDTVFTQYREVGVFLWRGFTLNEIMHQCFSTHKVTVAFFGEGAASEGDVHAAMNMAATLKCPTLFICRNNGYAISTSTDDQYAGDGIAARAIGYGMRTVRVDGNDLFAVYSAVEGARKIALENNCPVLIELMTYRVGHHSTSDDSTAYRSVDEVNYWNREDSPVGRLQQYLVRKKLWDVETDQNFSKECRKDIMAAFNLAESSLKPSPFLAFDDVYETHTTQLSEQIGQLKEHLEEYGEHYNLKDYDMTD